MAPVRLFLAAFVAFVLFIAFAVVNGTKVEVSCGPQVSTPAVVRLLDGAETAGKALNSLRDMYTDGPTPLEIFVFVMRVKNLIGLVGDTFGAALRGEKAPKDAEGLRRQSERNQAAAIASCSCVTEDQQQDNPAPQDPAAPDPWDPKDATLVSLGRADGFAADQRKITATAIQVAAAHHLPDRAVLVAITAALVESGVHNLNYGDRDSQGVWQQRPSAGWGSVAQIRNVRLAAEAFYGVAKHTNNPGLTDIANWQNRPVGEVAQAVQVSAFPYRYEQKVAEARRLIDSVGDMPAPADPLQPDQADCEPPAASPQTESVSSASLANLQNRRSPVEAVAFMQNMVDKQIDDNSGRCLHWVGMAYGYPTTADYYAIDQWRNAPAKYKHPGDRNPPAGALMFWDTGKRAGHIALSAGGGKVFSTDTSARDRVGLHDFSYFKGYGKYVGWTDPFFRGQTRTGVQA